MLVQGENAFAPAVSASPRSVVFVTGPDRETTGALAYPLHLLGLHVPDPAPVLLGDSGLAESMWAVRFHQRNLRRVQVIPDDARPQSWLEASRLLRRQGARSALDSWLETSCTADTPELLVNDHRAPWCLGLWQGSALRTGVTLKHAVVVRDPHELLVPNRNRFGALSAYAGWVNRMLHVERWTRGAPRAFVRHDELVDDWTAPTHRVATLLDLRAVQSARASRIKRISEHWAQPRQMRAEAPACGSAPLREIVLATWEQLGAMTDPASDVPKTHAVLDELRCRYTDLYREAEELTASTVVAALARQRARPRTARPEPSALDQPEPMPMRSGVGMRSWWSHLKVRR